MSKLDALKTKLATLKAQLAEKTDKIAFIKKWREKRAAAAASAAAPAAPKAQDPHSLAAIYRDGSTGTRLQVIAFYVFVIVAVVSAGSLVKKIAVKLRSSAANEQLKHDISHGIAETRQKRIDEADMLALGQFTTNIYVGPPEDAKMMNIDLWIRVSDPATATTINKRNEVFREKTMDALNDVFVRKINLLKEDGKIAAKDKIRASLNTALTAGKVEEVFIQNLVVQ